MTIKKIILSILFFFSGLALAFSQEASDSTAAQPVKKPLERSPFESGIFMDYQTVAVPPAKTLEFILQHRFGNIQNGIKDIYGLWGASNIRLGLNFTPMKNLMIGLGTTKNYMVQDLQVKYTFLHQRKGGCPLSIAYYGNLGLDTKTSNTGYGTGYKFSDRFSWYHEFMFARRFGKMFSMQVGLAYSHFNKVDTVSTNDVASISVLGRLKVSPQSSIILAFEQPIVVNYDPAFVVKYPNQWLSIKSGTSPYQNVSLGWEISTSTHTFQIFLAAANGIVPQYVTAKNTSNFWNGYILFGFNITRLWSF
ncbi:MAG: DUF5777 family beta-barrel protein [Bacteroidetes bacterium]|nr:DUF5777 family beta-barrel protein [Bacteroidota bacterium]